MDCSQKILYHPPDSATEKMYTFLKLKVEDVWSIFCHSAVFAHAGINQLARLHVLLTLTR